MATIKVNNWDEFVAAIETSGAVVECPAGEIWNMNDIAPTGIPQINVKCARINGNGLIVRNLRSTAESVLALDPNTNIYDLDFLSFYISRKFTSINTSRKSHQWYGCRFSGISTGSEIVFDGGWESYANDCYKVSPNTGVSCSFNVICHNGTLFCGYYSATTTIEYGQIKFVGKKLAHTQSGYSYNVKFFNCLVLGEFESALGVSSEASVFDCTAGKIAEYGGFQTSIVNKDKCTNYPSSAIAVTSEQLMDAQYLSSQGFPIGV